MQRQGRYYILHPRESWVMWGDKEYWTALKIWGRTLWYLPITTWWKDRPWREL